MASLTVVERLLKHLDDNAGSFYRLWAKPGATPRDAVGEFRDMIETANSDLEDDYFEIGNLIEGIIEDLSSDDVFELGCGILYRKTQYRDKYQ